MKCDVSVDAESKTCYAPLSEGTRGVSRLVMMHRSRPQHGAIHWLRLASHVIQCAESNYRWYVRRVKQHDIVHIMLRPCCEMLAVALVLMPCMLKSTSHSSLLPNLLCAQTEHDNVDVNIPICRKPSAIINLMSTCHDGAVEVASL